MMSDGHDEQKHSLAAATKARLTVPSHHGEPPVESNEKADITESPSIVSRADNAVDRPAESASQLAVELRRERVAFGAIMFSMFLDGWNDGTIGPMLPAIQKQYSVR